ncbi:hypothetical protein [Kineosporia succinea]|uniref:GGDEF domain-containing protein n=1 Tax=Kineosporia succinea TaxID=84632 RepID=A0ABT9PB42_9ACTN|nr:hypothetical protein [Kineosporia succinea]MDP9829918.1 hypothetical protein [Kineosporia succinea]
MSVRAARTRAFPFPAGTVVPPRALSLRALSLRLLAALSVAAALFTAGPRPGSATQQVTYLVSVVVSVLFTVVVTLRLPAVLPARERRPYQLLCASSLVFVVAESLAVIYGLRSPDVFPTPGDVLAVAAYAPFVLGVLGLEGAVRRPAFGGLLDAAIVAAGGVARWDGTEDGPSLTARADEALYRAKRSGRDRLVVCVPPARVAHG